MKLVKEIILKKWGKNKWEKVAGILKFEVKQMPKFPKKNKGEIFREKAEQYKNKNRQEEFRRRQWPKTKRNKIAKNFKKENEIFQKMWEKLKDRNCVKLKSNFSRKIVLKKIQKFQKKTLLWENIQRKKGKNGRGELPEFFNNKNMPNFHKNY